MVTRRFDEDEPVLPSNPSSPAHRAAAPPPAQRPAPPSPNAPKKRIPRGAARRKGPYAHIPRTLTQVLNEANEMVVSGDLSDYVPLPTGFVPLDAMIGGGLRNTELVLLGGPQGIGKTITTLQMARNVALNSGHYAFFLSYEHTETHLMNRLLCLESVNPPVMDLGGGVRLKDLYGLVTGDSDRPPLRAYNSGSGSLQAVLRRDKRTAIALQRMQMYSDRLILVKASPAVTTLRAIREMTARLTDATAGKVVVFVDYLQKIAIHPLRAADEAEKVTIIVEGLKDMALALGVPVFAIVAADREGLKSKRLHLYNLRGSSALDYECDIAIIMNNKYHILSKDHIAFNPYEAKKYRDWVIFTIEKNRAGRAMVDMEFQLYAQYFAFDPQGQQVQQQLIDDKIIEQ
ncbi:MAG: AAA family ATPase [Anaerolineae bacterium]|nr:AAA family ATPase [Anaerolineae bacterium]